MPREIATVAFKIPGGGASYIPFHSKSSLLDYDITIFDPSIYEFYGLHEDYRGKPCLDDSHSFRLKEQLEHWRQEIHGALIAGKTVFVLLNSLQEVYVATGERTYSGTGRNRQTTRQVALCRNYDFIPGGLKVRSSNGTSMRLEGKDNVLAAYWSDFGDESEYRVLIDDDKGLKLVITKTGNQVAGARYRFKNVPGALYLLPYVDFERDSFTYEKDSKVFWTDKAISLGKRFVGAVVELDKVTLQSAESTPMPTWLSSNNDYSLPAEMKLHGKLLKIESQIKSLNKEKDEVLSKISSETVLKGLLYEKGMPLETAIVEALKLLGFEASQYKDSESEFDVVFECKKGRLLGEAEGKDSKAINIDKLRQLEMNIHEDFARDEIDEPAKGVLFGNAYRLTPPEKRGDFFTQKCLTSAKRSQTALVRTTDLFAVTRYLSIKKDARFAKKCRTAILSGVGIVEFHEIPEPKSITSTDVESK